MAVYVDDMRAKFGRMVMCHMLADTEEELVAMAERIGVARKWHQYPGTFKSHFDIALSKRALAVEAGAVEVDWRFVGNLMGERRRAAVAAKSQASVTSPDGLTPPATNERKDGE